MIEISDFRLQISDFRLRFEAFAARKEREALAATMLPCTTEIDRDGDEVLAIGNGWSRALFDGQF